MRRARQPRDTNPAASSPIRVQPKIEPLEDRLLPSAGIQTIQHVIIIAQENRSFDSYFGTYPGADGIPMKNGVPTVALFDPLTGKFQKPYYNPSILNQDDPHTHAADVIDVNGGKMDGFIRAYRQLLTSPSAVSDVMGYHDNRQIPNYWSYAQNFVLQDHLFSSASSWSLPNHNYLVSGWSAKCTDPNNPMS
jgi:phospholipase C